MALAARAFALRFAFFRWFLLFPEEVVAAASAPASAAAAAAGAAIAALAACSWLGSAAAGHSMTQTGRSPGTVRGEGRGARNGH